MNEEAADAIVAAIQRFVDDVAQLERQMLIENFENSIKDYRLRQPNRADAEGKVDASYENLVKVLVKVTQ